MLKPILIVQTLTPIVLTLTGLTLTLLIDDFTHPRAPWFTESDCSKKRPPEFSPEGSPFRFQRLLVQVSRVPILVSRVPILLADHLGVLEESPGRGILLGGKS
jgi:hypothetical protein